MQKEEPRRNVSGGGTERKELELHEEAKIMAGFFY